MMTTIMQSKNNVENIPSVSEGMDKLGISEYNHSISYHKLSISLFS